MKNTTSRKTFAGLLALVFLTLFTVAASAATTGDQPGMFNFISPSAQLDPDDRNYVLDVFTIEKESMDVLVTKTASGPYPAFKEYWRTNQDMLGAIAGATSGTAMSLSGVSYNGAAPEGYATSMRMQASVEWETAAAPSGLSWVYTDKRTNKLICIQFNLAGKPGDRAISSITWYLAAASAPRTGTFVFHDGTKYSLLYTDAPALPEGYSWYAVKVYPGS